MKNDFLIYCLVTGVISLVSLLITPLLSNYLSPEEFAIVGLFLGLTQISALIIGWSSNFIIVKSFHFRKDLNVLLGTSILFSSSILIVVLIIFLLTPVIYLEFFGINKNYIILAVVSSYFMILSANFQSYFQMSKKVNLWSLVSLGGALSSAFITFMFIYINSYVFEGRILALVAANLISLTVGLFLIKNITNIRFEIKREHFRLYLLVGSPLLISAICTWSQKYIDRFFLTNMVSETETGLYVFSLMLSSPLLILFTTYTRVWGPKAYELLAIGNYKKHREYLIFSIVGYVIVSIMFSSIAPYIYGLLIDKSFNKSLILIPWFSLINFLIGINGLIQPCIICNNKEKHLSIISAIGLMLNIILYLFLIPVYDMEGAIYSNVFVMFLISILMFTLTKRQLIT